MFQNSQGNMRGSSQPSAPPAQARNRAPSNAAPADPHAAQLAAQYDQDKERIVRSCFSKQDESGLCM